MTPEEKALMFGRLYGMGAVSFKTMLEGVGLREEYSKMAIDRELEGIAAQAQKTDDELASLVQHHLFTTTSHLVAIRDEEGNVVDVDKEAMDKLWVRDVMANWEEIRQVIRGHFDSRVFITGKFFAKCKGAKIIHEEIKLMIPKQARLSVVGLRLYVPGGPKTGFAIAKRRGHVFWLEKRAEEYGFRGPWYLRKNWGEEGPWWW